MSFSDEKKTPTDELKAQAYVSNLESGAPGENGLGQRTGEHLQPKLLPRHLAMISIGGVIGTGLFLGSGGALAKSGPVALWLGYIVVGMICMAMMRCLEMVAYLPLPGGPIKMADRFVNPALSFAVGWNYWFNWTIILPAELSAAAVLVSFWSDLNPAIWISIFLVLVVAINFLGARTYGEVEFWACSIKVITIIGLIILSFALIVGAGDQGTLGFRYWRNPGPFVQFNGIPGSLGRFLAFFNVFTQAAFSYIGTEIVAIAAGEAMNPRRTIPKAIKSVWIRICFFYILGTLCIGMICASNNEALGLGSKTAARSPFVIAIKAAGIKGLPSVINAALVTSAVSAASSDMYTSSRALYSLAITNQAPRFFGRTTTKGLPLPALVVSAAFSLLSFMSVSSGANRVFGWFANLTAICGLTSWAAIGFTAIRFYKGIDAQGISRKSLPLGGFLQPFFGYFTFISTTIIIFFSGFAIFLRGNFNLQDLFTTYIPIPLFFVLLTFGYFRSGRQGMVHPTEMDFITGLQEIIDAETEDGPVTMLDKAFKVLA